MSITVVDRFTPNTPIPLKDDGSKWPHALLFEEQLLLSDTAHELLAEAFIPGYEEIPEGEEGDEAALYERYLVATRVASMTQVRIMADYNKEVGDEKFAELSEEIITAAFAPRGEPIPLDGSAWTGPFPLVAIATDYAPFRPSLKVPKGEVLLINPYTDTTLLKSLHALGECQYRVYEGNGVDLETL